MNDSNLSRKLVSELSPPPFLGEVRDLIKAQHRELWNWIQTQPQCDAHDESVRLDLLKSTVRIAPESNPEIYDQALSAMQELKLKIPVTIYQAQQSGQLNASISAQTNHAHIVFQGDLSDRLNEDELRAVLGHELGHLLMWMEEDGDFFVLVKALVAMANDPDVSPIHNETLRRFSQYTEIYCDRCALIAQGDFDPVISALIKIETGMKTVKVSDYLKQANEIYSHDDGQGSTTITHPELFIRTRALHLWLQQAENHEAEIRQMVQGQLSLDRMDLVRQREASRLTRDLIDWILAPDWMQCDETLAHAKLFFDDYKVGRLNRSNVTKAIESSSDDFRDFVCYLMLDFVTCDRDLIEPGLTHTIELAETFGIKDRFVVMARKELRLRKKQLQQIEKGADELIAAALKKKSKNERTKKVVEPIGSIGKDDANGNDDVDENGDEQNE